MKISNFSKISSNIFGSRVTGFIRDILFANYLGANLMSDAFLFAYRLPNLFRRIFAEGSMNSVFIPLYVCLLYTSPSPRDGLLSRMPSSA